MWCGVHLMERAVHRLESIDCSKHGSPLPTHPRLSSCAPSWAKLAESSLRTIVHWPWPCWNAPHTRSPCRLGAQVHQTQSFVRITHGSRHLKMKRSTKHTPKRTCMQAKTLEWRHTHFTPSPARHSSKAYCPRCVLHVPCNAPQLGDKGETAPSALQSLGRVRSCKPHMPHDVNSTPLA
jgi:hypothetical protein